MDKNLLLTKAQNAELSRDFQTATRLYKELLTEEPDNLEYLSTIGSIYVKSNEDEKALPYYQRIIELFPHSVSAMNGIGAIFRRLKRYDESIEILKRALNENKEVTTIYYTLGFTYREMKLYDEAIDCFERVVSENASDVLAYNHLGSIYSAKGDYQKAIESFKHGLQIDQNHPILNYNLAHCFESLELYPDAIRSYEVALKTKPAWAEAIHDFSNLLLTCKKTKEAQNIVQRSLRLYPNDAKMLCILGKVFLTQYDFDSAEKTFKKAKNLNPKDVEILSGLADALEKGEKNQEALDTLEDALGLDPENLYLLKQYASTLLSAKDYEEAFKKIDTLYKSNEEDVQILDLYGQYYACMNDEESTNYYHEKINQVDKSYKSHLLSTARRYSQIGNKDRAESYAKNYIQKFENDPAGYNTLGKVYASSGDYDNAIVSYTKGLELQKDNVLADKQIAELMKKRIIKKIDETSSDSDNKKDENGQEVGVNQFEAESEFDFDLLGQNEKEDLHVNSEEHFWDNLSDEFEDSSKLESLESEDSDNNDDSEDVSVLEDVDDSLNSQPDFTDEDDLLDDSVGLEEISDDSISSLQDLVPELMEDSTMSLPIEDDASLTDDSDDIFEFGNLDELSEIENQESVSEEDNGLEEIENSTDEPEQLLENSDFQDQNAISESLQQKLQESILNSANAAMETALNTQRMVVQMSEEQEKIKMLQEALEEKQHETEEMEEELVMQKIKTEQLQQELIEKRLEAERAKLSESVLEVEPVLPKEQASEVETDLQSESAFQNEHVLENSVEDIDADDTFEESFEELEELDDSDLVEMNEIENEDENISSQQMFYLVNDNIVPEIDESDFQTEEKSNDFDSLIYEILVGEYEFPSVDTILADILLQLSDEEKAIIESISSKEKTESKNDFDTTDSLIETESQDSNFDTTDSLVEAKSQEVNFDTTDSLMEDVVDEENDSVSQDVDFDTADSLLETELEESNFDTADSLLETEDCFDTTLDILTNGENEWEEDSKEESQTSEIQDLFHKVEEMLSDDFISQVYKSELDMFKKLKALIEFLPNDIQTAIDLDKLRVQIEYIISRISGKPGLCKTISLLFESGYIELENSKQNINTTEKMSQEEIKGVFQTIRNLSRNLEDIILADSLCKLIDELLEKM